MKSFSNAERAQVLTDALPHIRQYTGRTVVVKYGGHAMVSEELKDQVMEDIVLLHLIGVRIVLVHGGGPEITELMERLGKKAVFENGMRVTDAETIEVAQMVLAGKINKNLVNKLEMRGGNAVGISGMDGRLLEAGPVSEALGFVGEITAVNIQPVTDLLDGGYIPVISTLGCDREGAVYNINADTAAAAIAGALQAECLLMTTDVPGVLADPENPDSILSEITAREAQELIDEGVISGGMIPKVTCCLSAIEQGTDHVVIMDGRIPHAVLMELLTYEGAGTYIRRDGEKEEP